MNWWIIPYYDNYAMTDLKHIESIHDNEYLNIVKRWEQNRRQRTELKKNTNVKKREKKQILSTHNSSEKKMQKMKKKNRTTIALFYLIIAMKNQKRKRIWNRHTKTYHLNSSKWWYFSLKMKFNGIANDSFEWLILSISFKKCILVHDFFFIVVLVLLYLSFGLFWWYFFLLFIVRFHLFLSFFSFIFVHSIGFSFLFSKIHFIC